MKLEDLAFLSLRLLAVYFFYLSVVQLVNYYYSAMMNAYQLGGEVEWGVLVQLHVLPFLILLGSGILLWAFARKGASILIGGRKSSSPSAVFHATYSMLLSVAGVVVMMVSAGDLVKAILLYFSGYAVYTDWLVERQQLYEIVSHAVQLALGLGLVLYVRKTGKLHQSS